MPRMTAMTQQQSAVEAGRLSGVLDEIGGPPPRDIGYDLLPRLAGRARSVS
jgi:hypothetical protein